ncbi:MAG: hypothetical protein AB1633_05380 [Elusimicrobiota bacterium]
MSKTRPIAIICEPPEAAPGDTVEIFFHGFIYGEQPVIRWTAALDFAFDMKANEIIENRVILLDSLMLQGSTSLHFRFVVPESTLLYSTMLRSSFNVIGEELGMSLEQADSFLKGFRSNPTIGGFGIMEVDAKGIRDPDSIKFFSHKTYFLYPDTADDTIEIGRNKSYFAIADSGINGNDTDMQSYTYISSIDSTFKTEREIYFYDWFYTNLDYRSPMKMDSLILLPGYSSRSIVALLPPVDTAMHNFKLYLAVRDNRPNQGTISCGVAYCEAKGYFKYTADYAKNPR